MAVPRKNAASPTPKRGGFPSFRTIDVAARNDVALITLNRPKTHNAFDEIAIAELTEALMLIDAMAEVRAVVLLGEGESFCAGADLNWMRRMADFDDAGNLADARALARLLAVLAGLSKPTIARVHGAAFGGGVGLVACCDIAIAAQAATFALSEVKLGIIPATISPYVIDAIGARHARRYFLTGERFDCAEAFRIGLVHDIVPSLEALDARINEILGALLLAGPNAQAAAKALVAAVARRTIDDALIDDTAQRIAVIRRTDEAREGIAAFLARRPPAWVPQAAQPKKRR
jgi:methylglutaconyl-CoA hydratase